MKILRFRLDRLRGLIEWGWLPKIAGKMAVSEMGITNRMNGRTRWQIQELNQMVRVLNELRLERYGHDTPLIGIDEFLDFEESTLDAIQLPDPAKRERRSKKWRQQQQSDTRGEMPLDKSE